MRATEKMFEDYSLGPQTLTILAEEVRIQKRPSNCACALYQRPRWSIMGYRRTNYSKRAETPHRMLL